MPAKSEQTFANWTGRPSDAEDERYNWTRDQIRQALRGGRLDQYDFDVYAKGSYPNHTNVVRDSDVDIAAELTSIIQHEFIHSARGLSLSDFGIQRYEGDYGAPSFKDDVEHALVEHFGRSVVTRGNKSIHIRQTSSGLKADVVPCMTLISHSSRQSQRHGIQIEPDRGPIVHNFPRQHLGEGVRKNDGTYRRYKRVVRILKRLENEMVDARVIDSVPSFLVESLTWNVPDRIFIDNSTWTSRVKESLRHLYFATDGPEPEEQSDRLLEPRPPRGTGQG